MVVNATGPFTDAVRRMSSPDEKPIVTPSAGAHITLPEYYSPKTMGLIVPKTRVSFVEGIYWHLILLQCLTVFGT